MMLADPRLVVIELIHPLDQFQVALERQRGVFVNRMKGRDKSAEAQSGSGHWISFFRSEVGLPDSLRSRRRIDQVSKRSFTGQGMLGLDLGLGRKPGLGVILYLTASRR